METTKEIVKKTPQLKVPGGTCR